MAETLFSLSFYPDFVILFLIVLILILTCIIILTPRKIEHRARVIFATWKTEELDRWRSWLSREADERAKVQAEALTKDWKIREEKRIRQDAVFRSQSVIRGKMTEHLIPWFSDFMYNPSDARFLGSPVDFIVFDGLSEGNLKELIIVEVKTGSSSLSPRERSVARVIEEGKIRFEIIRKE